MSVVELVVSNAEIDIKLAAAIFVARSELAERRRHRDRARFRDLITEEVRRLRLFPERAQRPRKLSLHRAKDGGGRCILRPGELGHPEECQHANPGQAVTELHVWISLG